MCVKRLVATRCGDRRGMRCFARPPRDDGNANGGDAVMDGHSLGALLDLLLASRLAWRLTVEEGIGGRWITGGRWVSGPVQSGKRRAEGADSVARKSRRQRLYGFPGHDEVPCSLLVVAADVDRGRWWEPCS